MKLPPKANPGLAHQWDFNLEPLNSVCYMQSHCGILVGNFNALN